MEKITRKNVVLSTEADAWFLRNKDMLVKKTDFPHLESIMSFIQKDQNVLEIGSSFGHNLNYLVAQTECKAYGIEPSSQAVKFGSELYKNILLKQGTIDQADLYQEEFDHVIIGFCLYLVDEQLLPEIVYRIDKILKKGGYLHIFDFDSKYPIERDYSHDTRIKSRKMDYGQVFTTFPNYFLAEKRSWSHYSKNFHIDPNERCSTVTIYKELGN